jgi:hypothetical protein
MKKQFETHIEALRKYRVDAATRNIARTNLATSAAPATVEKLRHWAELFSFSESNSKINELHALNRRIEGMIAEIKLRDFGEDEKWLFPRLGASPVDVENAFVEATRLSDSMTKEFEFISEFVAGSEQQPISLELDAIMKRRIGSLDVNMRRLQPELLALSEVAKKIGRA